MSEREPGIKMAQVLELLGQGKSGTEIAKAVLTEHKLEQVPRVEELMLLAEFLLARTERLMKNNVEPWNAFICKEAQIPQEDLVRLEPCFKRILDATSIALQRKTYPTDSLGFSSDMTPGERPGVEALQRVRNFP